MLPGVKTAVLSTLEDLARCAAGSMLPTREVVDLYLGLVAALQRDEPPPEWQVDLQKLKKQVQELVLQRLGRES